LTDSILHVDHLSLDYGQVRAIDDLSFKISDGEILGMLGTNGAGKSTCVSCVLGLLTPTAGRIVVDGYDISKDRRKAVSRLGAQLQSTALQDKIKVIEAITLFRSFYDEGACPHEILKEVELMDLSDRYFFSLSQGEKQRLALAMALVNDPKLLVLDEPTASMDPQTKYLTHRIILDRAKKGTAVLLATQMIDEAQSLCDRVMIIDQGKVLVEGVPREMISASDLPTRLKVLTSQPFDVGQWDAQVREVKDGCHETILMTQELPRVISECMMTLQRDNITLLDIVLEQPSLEDVYLAHTGRKIH
jgi:ABC-2 type transport system ATP-binding protein